MACLSHEQLVAAALSADHGERLPAHIHDCAACRSTLDEIRQLTDELAAVHAPLNRDHLSARARLLNRIQNVDIPIQPISRWGRLARQLTDLSIAQRIAAGSLGVTTVVTLLWLFVAMTSASRLSAMERMVKAVREVKSYSYKMFSQDTFFRKGDTHPSTVIHTGTTWWQEPSSVFYDEKLERFEEADAPSNRDGQLLTHLTGIHPTGQHGMLIYHAGSSAPSMVHTYNWVPELRSMSAEEIGDESPITRLRMVREWTGEVIRELGTKEIGGKQARGYIMALSGAKPGSGFDELEVWVDSETDLPMEFGYERKEDKTTQIFRISDCRWNIDVDAKLFDTTPPDGYEDITPPSDEKSLAEIVAVLKLYARLSGGHYPKVSTIDVDAIRDEMFALAGFSDLPQENWKADPKLVEIQKSTTGLKWLARILRHKFNAGYQGHTVGPADKEKALLWWMVAVDQSYRVFYGDLRTEVLPLAKWAQLVPEEVAVIHLPELEALSKDKQ
jgi:outer membrane lipoprotein-sorting protein